MPTQKDTNFSPFSPFSPFFLVWALILFNTFLYWEFKNIVACISFVDTLNKAKLYHTNVFDFLKKNQAHIHQLLDAVLFLQKNKILTANNLRKLCLQPQYAQKTAQTIYLQFYVEMLEPLQELAEPTCCNPIMLFFSRRLRLAHNRDQAIANNYAYLKLLTETFIANNSTTTAMTHGVNCSSACVVCGVADDDKAIKLGCGHYHHFECYNNCINSYLNQERPERFNSCVSEGCDYKLLPAELANVINQASTIIDVQKLMIRSIPGVIFCPACSGSVTKELDKTGFSAHCTSCKQNICYACGDNAHANISCSIIVRRKEYLVLAAELIRENKSNDFGMCPHCELIAEKARDTCNAVVCGVNFHTLFRYFRSKGCGSSFEWDERITLMDFINKYKHVYPEINSTPRTRLLA